MIQNYKIFSLHVVSEIAWWIFIFLFTAIILYPIYSYLQPHILGVNSLLIMMSVLLLRYTIFFHQTAYFKFISIRFLFGVISFILFFQVIKQIQDFYEWFDTHDYYFFFLSTAKQAVPYDTLQNDFFYFRKEFIFFAIMAAMMLVIFIFRLIASLWSLLKGKNF